MRQRPGSQLAAGVPYIVLDNLSRRLDSVAFVAMLTSTEWNDVACGSSTIMKLPVFRALLATSSNAERPRAIDCQKLGSGNTSQYNLSLAPAEPRS